mmetsp:Transcript_33763/g.54155  ORF Transcript_33763/g.54155 Transcript_33763/m.54155 type:complete len:207 (-) Transcript_33763:2557-3177(-)
MSWLRLLQMLENVKKIPQSNCVPVLRNTVNNERKRMPKTQSYRKRTTSYIRCCRIHKQQWNHRLRSINLSVRIWRQDLQRSRKCFTAQKRTLPVVKPTQREIPRHFLEKFSGYRTKWQLVQPKKLNPSEYFKIRLSNCAQTHKIFKRITLRFFQSLRIFKKSRKIKFARRWNLSNNGISRRSGPLQTLPRQITPPALNMRMFARCS